MHITALYKVVGEVSILAICTKEDWRLCDEHRDCYPAAVTVNIDIRAIDNGQLFQEGSSNPPSNKSISAISLKTGKNY
jgi:hypothetical protein